MRIFSILTIAICLPFTHSFIPFGTPYGRVNGWSSCRASNIRTGRANSNVRRCITGVKAFTPSYKFPRLGNPPYQPPPPMIEPPPPQHPTIIQKIDGLINLTRIRRNFLPITILNVLNGMIIDPTHFSVWIKTPSFIAASVMVYLLTSGSMIVNDLYDMNVDRINNPNRPLISGIVKPYEAAVLSGVLFSIYVYLGIFWIPDAVGPIWRFSLVALLLYTPYLKRIPIVKNLTCASIIASTVPFMGAAIKPGVSLYDISVWVPLTTRTLFITSIFIELVLDISDREGDAKTGIYTLPVLIGSQPTSRLLTGVLFMNYIQSVLLCGGVLDPVIMMSILVNYVPLFVNIGLIQRSRFSKSVIHRSVAITTGSMILYFACYLAWLYF